MIEKNTRARGAAYKRPILLLGRRRSWNLLGAGVFGFMINPPTSLRYIQGG